jgi:hypothetical protein
MKALSKVFRSNLLTLKKYLYYLVMRWKIRADNINAIFLSTKEIYLLKLASSYDLYKFIY